MPTYSLDPLHPAVLVCQVCGRAVAGAPTGVPATEALTCRQLAAAGLELAALVAVAKHDVLCVGRRAEAT
jgi:hypothetical protein